MALDPTLMSLLKDTLPSFIFLVIFRLFLLRYDFLRNSKYLDTVLHMYGNSTTNFGSICLYESYAFPI
ncbi:hypothetical protein BJ165DRAFT_1510894 [Panaeolus papilionaceus]|nr:hypothetical protein BJ165DRAFT_1510894 [Panaeolus papilionaceus]